MRFSAWLQTALAHGKIHRPLSVQLQRRLLQSVTPPSYLVMPRQWPSYLITCSRNSFTASHLLVPLTEQLEALDLEF